MIPSDIDPERFEQQWALNLDILDSLAQNGDKSEIPRTLDVSFIGSSEALDELESAASELGFSVQGRNVTDDGEEWLFLERLQTTDAEAIENLTVTYIRIEDRFGVYCDGWGCVAQDGMIN